MTGIFNGASRMVRQQRASRWTRRSVEHLDARLLRDAGLETYAPERLSRPFWWLWRRSSQPD
jgi:hypothetical protein